MKKIEVCLSPELIHLYEFTGKIVVIVDIFRASSTMVTALANGVTSITPFKDLDACRSMQEKGFVIAGERNGKKAEDFELGNSPLPYLNEAFFGKKIAMTTTNGTLAIDSVGKKASKVMIGAFINLNATAAYLKNTQEDLLIYCAGWKGKFNLEDSLYAGALADALEFNYSSDCDSTLAVRKLFQSNRENLKAFLSEASHTKRLQNQNIEKDIDFCLSIDRYNIVAFLENGNIILGQ